jgi:hypothetical protein
MFLAVGTLAGLAVPDVAGASAGPIVSPTDHFPSGDTPNTTQGPVPRASCGPGSNPETGPVQGEVTIADRESGRSSLGYTCNLKLVGRYGPDDPQGFEGAEWQLARYRDTRGVDCAYYSQRLVGMGTMGARPTQERRGTIVVDVSDPAHPKFAANLFTLGMMDPWESLKVNQSRGLLVAVNVMDGQGVAFMGVYDIRDDCRHPKKRYDGPVTVLNHEGNFSSDGKTYYSGGAFPGIISAVDLSDPTNPRLLTQFLAKLSIHGMSTNLDGTRLFLAHLHDDFWQTYPRSARGDVRSITGGYGMGIYDISEIQQRKPNPQAKLVSALEWPDGQGGQHTIPVFKDGEPYVIHVDEAGHGGARIIDIRDETKPWVVSKVKTEIMMPEHYDLAKSETSRFPKEDRGGFWLGYNTHYCNVDSQMDPTMLACSAAQQGLRLFDIRDFAHPKEIGYFNPGGDGTQQPGSWSGLYSGYETAMPQFVPDRHQIWFTDQDRGLYVVQPTNGTWLSSITEETVSHGD